MATHSEVIWKGISSLDNTAPLSIAEDLYSFFFLFFFIALRGSLCNRDDRDGNVILMPRKIPAGEVTKALFFGDIILYYRFTDYNLE